MLISWCSNVAEITLPKSNIYNREHISQPLQQCCLILETSWCEAKWSYVSKAFDTIKYRTMKLSLLEFSNDQCILHERWITLPEDVILSELTIKHPACVQSTSAFLDTRTTRLQSICCWPLFLHQREILVARRRRNPFHSFQARESPICYAAADMQSSVDKLQKWLSEAKSAFNSTKIRIMNYDVLHSTTGFILVTEWCFMN